jgi:hypothetical protein
MIIERRFGDAGRFDDLERGGAVKTLICKKSSRSVNDMLLSAQTRPLSVDLLNVSFHGRFNEVQEGAARANVCQMPSLANTMAA